MPSTRCVPGTKHSSRLGGKDTYLLSHLVSPSPSSQRAICVIYP